MSIVTEFVDYLELDLMSDLEKSNKKTICKRFLDEEAHLNGPPNGYLRTKQSN